MGTAAVQLSEALRAKQAAEGLNDAEFARRLGVSKALWSLLSNGKCPVSMKAVRGIFRAYPDLIPVVTLFLQSEDSILNNREQPSEQELVR